MLAGVGCKDYDDDIKDINNRIDELVTGKITPMEQQIKAIETTISNLQAADVALGQRIDALKADVTANASAITALETAQKQLKTDLDAIKADYVKQSALDQTLKSYATVTALGELAGKFDKLGVFTTEKAIQDAINAAKDAAVTAAGEAFEGAFQGKFDAAVTGAKLVNEGALSNAIEEYDTKIKQYISDAIANDGIIDQAIASKISTAMGTLKEDVAKLQKDVDALIAQIQSLVNVPEYADGTTEMKTYSFGGTEAGSMVVLKYRVTPAKLAADMAALFANGKMSLVTEEVKTRAAVATITNVAVVDATAGTFAVTANFGNTYPTAPNTAAAVALSINAPVGEGSVVANDVVSNFSGVVKSATPTALTFALYNGATRADANQYEEDATISVVWNTTKANSKREILKDLELKVSLDGENFISLEDAAAAIGSSFVVDKYSTTSNPAATNADFTIANVTNGVWGTNYASAQFVADGTQALAGKEVKFEYALNVKYAGAAAAEAFAGSVTYKVVNETGATLSFAKKVMPWTYSFVKGGLGAGTLGADITTPVIGNDVFGEIALTTTGTIPAGVKLSDIMGGTVVKSVKVNGAEDAGVQFDLTAFASQIAQGIKVAVPQEKYAWGKTYDLEYTYTYGNVDYVVKGSIEFGAKPADVVKNYDAVEIGYEDKTITGDWAHVYANVAAGKFTNVADFKDAIFAGTPAPTVTPATTLYATATATSGSPVANTNGTEMTASASTLKGVVNKLDIAANGNKFVQKVEWNTWYGQKVTVTMTYNVKLPAYSLVAQEAYVKDGVVTLPGSVNSTTFKWGWDEATLSAYYKANVAGVTVTFQKASVDGKAEDGTTADAGAVYATISGDKLDWATGGVNRPFVKIKAIATLAGSAIKVAETTFKVQLVQPISSISQAAAVTTKNTVNVEQKINMLKGLSLIDAMSKNWIKAAGTPEVVNTDQTANEVFSAIGGASESAGIVFTVKSAKTAGGQDFDASRYSVSKNELIIQANSAELQSDITFTVKAKFSHIFGGVEQDITVVLQK